MELRPECEWLEADGLGGFASGTVGLVRTRRYHALLLAATTPPTGRVVLVAGFDAFVERKGRREAISSHAYAEGIVAPDGATRLTGFDAEPWPRWTLRLADGSEIVQELFAVHGEPKVAVSWTLTRPEPGTRLVVRPLFAGRDYHALLRASADRDRLLCLPQRDGDTLVFSPVAGQPAVAMQAQAIWRQDPHWYRDVRLAEEAARGFDHHEDLASPGELVFDLSAGSAAWLVEARSIESSDDASREASDSGEASVEPSRGAPGRFDFAALRARELARRAAFETPVDRAADAYLVRRGAGRTIVAGYPWFTDWGRDTFIALRGLCLARGERALAREILLEWASVIENGLVPNRFADRGEAPEYNAVDASLWYVVAIESLLIEQDRHGEPIAPAERERLAGAVDAILSGFARGTRHAIHLDRDGLVAAGEPGVQLTWMDARVGERVVTPRIGKPVEVQALWWNALLCGRRFDARWAGLAQRVREQFARRFWNEDEGCLFDVVDVDHVAGPCDPRIRPNQLFAVGGLPRSILEGARAERVVERCERSLWTRMGPRSLAPIAAEYVPRYAGGPVERDLAYHQGTVWPWLAGAFVEGWVRVRGDSPAARSEARRRFLAPLRQGFEAAGLGHLPEIADAEAPHAPRGCPFQAWSLAEWIRLDRCVLAE